MSLDLSIRSMGPKQKDKQGHYYWTIVELVSLRNTWAFLDSLTDIDSVPNCCQVYFTGEQLYEAAENICIPSQQEEVLAELQTNSIENDPDTYYAIYAWW